MTLLIGILVGYVLCFISMVIRFCFFKAAHVEEIPFADDPRPALLKDQAS